MPHPPMQLLGLLQPQPLHFKVKLGLQVRLSLLVVHIHLQTFTHQQMEQLLQLGLCHRAKIGTQVLVMAAMLLWHLDIPQPPQPIPTVRKKNEI
jgi:hypothetical protein